MELLSRCLLIVLLVIILSVLRASGVCHRREIVGNLSIPGHQPLPLRYNVCIDNTTIKPEISMVRSGVATFFRECCGCRVSSVTERELRLHTIAAPSETRSIYVPQIRSCECIPCDSSIYNWAEYFMYLNHKRGK